MTHCTTVALPQILQPESRTSKSCPGCIYADKPCEVAPTCWQWTCKQQQPPLYMLAMEESNSMPQQAGLQAQLTCLLTCMQAYLRSFLAADQWRLCCLQLLMLQYQLETERQAARPVADLPLPCKSMLLLTSMRCMAVADVQRSPRPGQHSKTNHQNQQAQTDLMTRRQQNQKRVRLLATIAVLVSNQFNRPAAGMAVAVTTHGNCDQSAPATACQGHK